MVPVMNHPDGSEGEFKSLNRGCFLTLLVLKIVLSQFLSNQLVTFMSIINLLSFIKVLNKSLESYLPQTQIF